MTEADKSAILYAYDAMVQQRKSTGVADQSAVRAITRDVAHFFGIPKHTVAEQIKGRAMSIAANQDKQLLRTLADKGKAPTKGIRPSAVRLETIGLATLNKSKTTVSITPAGVYAAK